ncbi:MAG: taurine dioxygenase [Rhodospirillales bacterium]|nr:taurine dioxygenase [Rhodospirillales bacterium]
MGHNSIEVRKIAGALGAEVTGVDLSQPLDDDTYAAVRGAFVEHGVIFFRDQVLTPETHKRLSRCFGPFGETPFVKTMPGHPEIIAVIKEASDVKTHNFGGGWHSDFSFLERPPLGSLLYARDVPPYGGDTLWASMYLAYEELSDGLKQSLEGLKAVHSGRRSYGTQGLFASGGGVKAMTVVPSEAGDAEILHPVVRTHPESGRKALYINGVYTIRFEGWTEAESKPLLDYLQAHATRPEFTCRFRWSKGALAMWDNRCTQHNAINDYDGQRREMHRTTIEGERPV